MKVLLLAPSLDTGGAERQLVSLASGLSERGHDIHVALFRMQGALLDTLPDSVELHDLRRKGKTDFFGFILRLRKMVQNVRPDVVYSFLGVPNLAAILLKVLGVNVPVVWSVRASDVDLSKYSLLARACYSMEIFLSRYADHIVVNSNAGMKYALDQGFLQDRMSVVFNGIDTGRFLPDIEAGRPLRQQWEIAPDSMLVGIVARLDPMKDHTTFLRAAQIALRTDSALVFICIGDGPMNEQLREIGDSLGLGNNLVWAGNQTDMLAVYNALDVLCLSSISEGFPNVLGEGMSCGVPCVTTDVGDAAHEVGETGLVVPKSDPEAMAHAVLEMVGRVRDEQKPDTRTRIVSRFSIDRMVCDTEAILAEVIG